MTTVDNMEIFCVPVSARVRQVMEVIDRNREGIALVTDSSGKLIGTVTDGDIRRFLLAKRSLDEPVSDLMCASPLTAPLDAAEMVIREILRKYRILNLPLVDEMGRPKRLVTLRELLYSGEKKWTAVVMAGGEGKRLRPITETIPKPMVKVGEKPVLENILVSLGKSGITKIYLAVNYMAGIIEEYFQDGSKLGLEIRYLREQKKMGTAGALALLPETPSEPLLVVNGDIMTRTDWRHLMDFHRQHYCMMSVGVTQYVVGIPYGVLRLGGHYILGVEEKPNQQFFCNAGIYALNPEILRFIPDDSPFDMTDLMTEVVNRGLPAAAFPIYEQWIDIGKMEDLERARDLFSSNSGPGESEDK